MFDHILICSVHGLVDCIQYICGPSMIIYALCQTLQMLYNKHLVSEMLPKNCQNVRAIRETV